MGIMEQYWPWVQSPVRLGTECGSAASIYIHVCWKFSRLRNKKGRYGKVSPEKLFLI